jgi:hypothetical protein
MVTSAVTEDERAAKAALFMKYVEALPRALSLGDPHTGSTQGLSLACALLAGMREVVSVNRSLHQAFFRCGPRVLGLSCCRCFP